MAGAFLKENEFYAIVSKAGRVFENSLCGSEEGAWQNYLKRSYPSMSDECDAIKYMHVSLKSGLTCSVVEVKVLRT